MCFRIKVQGYNEFNDYSCFIRIFGLFFAKMAQFPTLSHFPYQRTFGRVMVIT